MKVKILTAFFCLVCISRTVCAQNQYFLAQVADGQFGSQSFRTTFILFNNNNVSAIALIKLTDDNANPLSVTIPELGSGSDFTVDLDAGATRIFQTVGYGNLVTGAATVTATARIGVSAIFTIYVGTGAFVTDSGVGSSEPLSEFVIPVDATGLFNTGLALLNIGNGTASISMVLLNTDGQEAGRTSITLNNGAHVARFSAGPGQLFPSLTNFRGTLQVHSSVPIAALALRQNASPLSYTALPVVPKSSTSLGLNLPQVANGTLPWGSFRTSFLIFNISSNAANVELTLSKSNGTPFVVTIPGQGTAGTFNFTLAPRASLFLQTDGSGALAVGAARINSTAPIGACAIFSWFDSQGRFQTEAGVGDSPVLTSLTFPVDNTDNHDGGVAFFNPGGAATTLTLQLLDANGLPVAAVAAAALTLQAKNHAALFVSEIFPETRRFRGSVAILAPGGVATLALRQNDAPLSYTTLPVTFGTSKGSPLLLSRTRTGISATTDVTVNETLPAGFLLSGTISGPGKASQVIAKDAGGENFAGFVNPNTSRYLIAVAPGSFTLKVCCKLGSIPSEDVTSTYTDPNPVQVTADTNRNITLPSQKVFSVSGTISGSSLPSSADATVVFTSTDGTAEGEFSLGSASDYQGQLPTGTYTASLLPRINFSSSQFELLSLFNLGSVNVSDAPVTAHFTVPATARIFGNVQVSGVSSFSISHFVTASDMSAPRTTDSSMCVLPPAFSSANVDASEYQMILARNRSYELDLTILLQQESQGVDVLVFPATPAMVTLNGDTNLDFNVPSLPGRVTISGRVTDSSGRGLRNVSVTASTQSLSGTTNVGFTAGATTDSNGNYRFTVLSGTNYKVLFVPLAVQPL